MGWSQDCHVSHEDVRLVVGQDFHLCTIIIITITIIIFTWGGAKTAMFPSKMYAWSLARMIGRQEGSITNGLGR